MLEFGKVLLTKKQIGFFMKVKSDEIEKYIKKNLNSTREEIASYFGVSVETVRLHTNKLGYFIVKQWKKK